MIKYIPGIVLLVISIMLVEHVQEHSVQHATPLILAIINAFKRRGGGGGGRGGSPKPPEHPMKGINDAYNKQFAKGLYIPEERRTTGEQGYYGGYSGVMDNVK